MGWGILVIFIMNVTESISGRFPRKLIVFMSHIKILTNILFSNQKMLYINIDWISVPAISFLQCGVCNAQKKMMAQTFVAHLPDKIKYNIVSLARIDTLLWQSHICILILSNVLECCAPWQHWTTNYFNSLGFLILHTLHK